MPDQFLGTAIRELRKQKNMTIEQLAEGICSKRQLQRIETNQNMPSAAIMAQLSKKLNENITDLYVVSGCKDPIKVFSFLFEVQKMYYFAEHEKMHEQCTNFLNENPDLPVEIYQAIAGASGYAAFQSQQLDNPDVAFFENLLKLTIQYTTLEDACTGFKSKIEVRNICHIISIRYFIPVKENIAGFDESHLKEGAILINKLLHNYLSTFKKYDNELLAELYMSCSLFHYLLKDFDNALKYCDEGLNKCKTQCNPLHLASIYGLRGEIFLSLGDVENGQKNLEFFNVLHEISNVAHVGKAKEEYFAQAFKLLEN